MQQLMNRHQELRLKDLSSMYNTLVLCNCCRSAADTDVVLFLRLHHLHRTFPLRTQLAWIDALIRKFLEGATSFAWESMSPSSSTRAHSILVHSLNRYPKRNQQLQYSAAVKLTGACEDSDHTQTKQVCAHQTSIVKMYL